MSKGNVRLCENSCTTGKVQNRMTFPAYRISEGIVKEIWTLDFLFYSKTGNFIFFAVLEHISTSYSNAVTEILLLL